MKVTGKVDLAGIRPQRPAQPIVSLACAVRCTQAVKKRLMRNTPR